MENLAIQTEQGGIINSFRMEGDRIITPWGDVWEPNDPWYDTEKERLMLRWQDWVDDGGGGQGNAGSGDLSDVCDEVYGDDGRGGRDWGHHSDNASQGAPLDEDSAGGGSGFSGGLFGR
jgi:hypothetical protein